MSRRLFRLCGAVTILVTGALIGWSIAVGNPVIPVPVAIGGAGMLYFCRKQLKEVVEDERNYRISEKASRLTIQVFAFAAAATGATLIALSISDASRFKDVGFTLAFSACGLLILYLAFYAYYSKKI